MLKTIVVILARGASSRVPQKPLQIIKGRPLLWYSLDYACKAQHTTEIAVMTECPRVEEAVTEYNHHHQAHIKLLRETDTSPNPVIRKMYNAIELYEHEIGHQFTFAIGLNGDCPIRPANIIDDMVNILSTTRCDGVETVIPVPIAYHPNRQYMIRRTGDIWPFNPSLDQEEFSQFYKPVYAVCGAGFALTRDMLSKAGYMGVKHMGVHLRPLICDPANVLEIDTLEDLAEAKRRIECKS